VRAHDSSGVHEGDESAPSVSSSLTSFRDEHFHPICPATISSSF
jgi:hypothetical protein